MSLIDQIVIKFYNMRCDCDCDCDRVPKTILWFVTYNYFILIFDFVIS